MYKLLIVDDEETIREGLCDIVDWKALGFEVIETLEDGEEAVEYVSKNSIDVIFTDIKMTFMSGLELAKHVQLNYPDIKVVIISGHQEFELARQAMSYNVKHYLLKPTRLEELKRVFHELKMELDRERVVKERLKKENEENSKLRLMLQEQFFTDLIMGALPNKADVDKRLKISGLNINPSLCKICVVNLNLSYDGNKLPEELEEENDSLYAALRKYTTNDEGDLYYFTNYNTFRNIKVLAIALEVMGNEALCSKVTAFIDKVAKKVKAIMGITLQGEIERVFDSMYDTAIHFTPIEETDRSREYKIEEIISKLDYSHLIRQQKLMVSYLKSQNGIMAKNVFENMLDELMLMDSKVIYNWIFSLFAEVKNDLAESGIDIRNEIFDYEAVLKLKDIREVKQWGCDALDNVEKLVNTNKNYSEKVVIQKAKEYIQGNYFKDIGLEEVADSVFLSPIYFSRLFKKQTHENFVDYLLKVRMSNALELLKDPTLKIYEVSVRVGYKNSKYFYKLFKEHTGFTPAEYRENVLKKDGEHE